VTALARWLEDGNEALHAAGAKLGSGTVSFLFRAAGTDNALIGAWGPGRDKVGRSFPLAIFAPVSARELASRFPVVPSLYRDFATAAQGLIADAAALALPSVAERLRALPLPAAPQWDEAKARLEELAGRERAGPMLQGLFDGAPAGQQYYALRTLHAACDPVKKAEPAKVHVTLDCPVRAEPDGYAWLELIRRTLSWLAPPGLFWREAPGPFLLASLGSPPAALLPYLAEPRRDTPKVWPLRTGKEQAIADARKALAPAQRALLERDDATVEELISTFCG
jgi:type VI secretion system protein ImpM